MYFNNIMLLDVTEKLEIFDEPDEAFKSWNQLAIRRVTKNFKFYGLNG